jgi:HSP20 family protein
LVVLIEIAGMRDSDFHVTLQNRRLVVSGVREGGDFARSADYHQSEIHYGEFRTEIVLPWLAQPDMVNAVYRDGFLRIEVPRTLNRGVHILDVGLEPGQDSEANA